MTKEQELQKIEKAILTLSEEKHRYQKKVTYHQDRGSLWQFNKDNSLESRREYFLAERDRDKIQLLELKIQNLQLQKKEILEE